MSAPKAGINATSCAYTSETTNNPQRVAFTRMLAVILSRLFNIFKVTMIKLSLEDIKRKVDELAAKLNAPSDLLPTYGYSRDFAYPHIEIDSVGLLHFVVVERGQQLERKTTDNLDTLLYWIFSGVTFSMSCTYELEHRIEDKDCRRIMFDKQEELLGTLSDTWRQKENEEHKKILKNYPFDDLAGLRATYRGQLRQQGYTEIDIDKLAYEKYPKN